MTNIATANRLKGTAAAKVVFYSRLYEGLSNRLPSILYLFGRSENIARLALFIFLTHGQATLNQYNCLILVQCTKIRVGNCTKIRNCAEPHISRKCVEPHISTILDELSWCHTHRCARHNCWVRLDQPTPCQRRSDRICVRRSWHANSGCV